MSSVDYDQIALDAARELMSISTDNPTQHQARIQCVIIKALRRSAQVVPPRKRPDCPSCGSTTAHTSGCQAERSDG